MSVVHTVKIGAVGKYGQSTVVVSAIINRANGYILNGVNVVAVLRTNSLMVISTIRSKIVHVPIKPTNTMNRMTPLSPLVIFDQYQHILIQFFHMRYFGSLLYYNRIMEELYVVKKFSLAGREIKTVVMSVYDGDTLTVEFNPFPDDKHSKISEFKVRMLGYNSPEMRPRKTAFMRKRIVKNANIAKNALASMVLNKEVVLYCSDFDSFGRILGTIYIDDTNVNNYMINHGYGVRF
jgi:hypothetical protein